MSLAESEDSTSRIFFLSLSFFEVPLPSVISMEVSVFCCSLWMSEDTRQVPEVSRSR